MAHGLVGERIDTRDGHGIAGRIDALIAPTLEAMGFAVVRVLISGTQRPKLQVMAEPVGGGTMTLDHCADISRAVSAVLDVEDPIVGAYVLEVSSPGIDRPLTRLGDYERFAGFDARVEMERPIDGRRRFSGRLLGTAGEAVRMRIGEVEITLPFAGIQRAKLLPTDELLAASESPHGTN